MTIQESTRLLRSPNFLKLWVGQTVSLFGSHIGGSGLRYAALLLLAAGPLELSLLTAAALLPALLLGLPAGVWVDRLRRRPLLIAADLGRALLLLSVPIAYVLGALRMEQLYAVTLITGALTVLFDTAYHSFLPSIVTRERLVEANSRLGMSDSVAEIAGPPLGGALVQVLSPPFAVLFDTLSFLGSALAIWRIDGREQPAIPAGQPRLWDEIMEGLRALFGDSRLRALLGCAATRSLGGGVFYALYSLFLVRDLGLSPAMVGLTVGVGGVGALAGAFLAEPAVRRFGTGRVLIGAQVLSSTANILIPLAYGPEAVVLLMLLLAQLADVAYAVYAINEVSLRQALIPDRLLGRAASSFTLVTTAALLAGALLGGALAEMAGARAALLCAVLIGLFGSVWLLASPLRAGQAQPAPQQP
jgi:predicted MFS family arabinose efflux permease